MRAISVFDPLLESQLAKSTALWTEHIKQFIVAAHRDEDRSDEDLEKTELILTTLVEGISGR